MNTKKKDKNTAQSSSAADTGKKNAASPAANPFKNTKGPAKKISPEEEADLEQQRKVALTERD